MKICRECRKSLSLENFSKNKYTKDGLEYFCKSCRKIKHFQNKKYNNKISREYYYNHRTERNEKAKQWKKENRERIKKYNRKYRQENRDICQFHKMRRKARKRGAGGSHTFEQWQELKKEYNYTCPICLRKEPDIKLTEDHIIAIFLWNDYIKRHPEVTYQCDDIENIQPLCERCNSVKRFKIRRYLNPKFINIEVPQNIIRNE